MNQASRRAARRAAFFAALLALALPVGAQAVAAWSAMPAPLLPLRLPVADAPGWALRAEAADFEAADATPVRALAGDWSRYTPRAGRNAALQSARLELAAAHAGWELAAVLRSDIVIDGSRGAFDAVRAYKLRLTLADGSSFAADAREQGVVWAGLRGARSWTLSPTGVGPLQFSAALTLVSVRRVQLTEVRGDVAYGSASGYGFDAQTLQRDSSKAFGGYGTPGTVGSGLTSDLGLLWQPAAGSFVNLSVADAWSRLRVRGVATQQTTFSSATRSTDAAGYLDYKPLAAGRYSAAELSLRLARKLSLLAGTRIGAPGSRFDGATVGLRWERVAAIDLPAVWAALPLAPGVALQLDAEARFRSFGLGLATRHASVLLRTRSLPVGGASALGWQASVSLPW